MEFFQTYYSEIFNFFGVIFIPDGESELTNAEFRQLRQAYRLMTNRHTNLKGQIDQAKIEIRTIRRYARMAKKRLDQHLESQGQRVENEG